MKKIEKFASNKESNYHHSLKDDFIYDDAVLIGNNLLEESLDSFEYESEPHTKKKVKNRGRPKQKSEVNQKNENSSLINYNFLQEFKEDYIKLGLDIDKIKKTKSVIYSNLKLREKIFENTIFSKAGFSKTFESFLDKKDQKKFFELQENFTSSTILVKDLNFIADLQKTHKSIEKNKYFKIFCHPTHTECLDLDKNFNNVKINSHNVPFTKILTDRFSKIETINDLREIFKDENLESFIYVINKNYKQFERNASFSSSLKKVLEQINKFKEICSDNSVSLYDIVFNGCRNISKIKELPSLIKNDLFFMNCQIFDKENKFVNMLHLLSPNFKKPSIRLYEKFEKNKELIEYSSIKSPTSLNTCTSLSTNLNLIDNNKENGNFKFSSQNFVEKDEYLKKKRKNPNFENKISLLGNDIEAYDLVLDDRVLIKMLVSNIKIFNVLFPTVENEDGGVKKSKEKKHKNKENDLKLNNDKVKCRRKRTKNNLQDNSCL